MTDVTQLGTHTPECFLARRRFRVAARAQMLDAHLDQTIQLLIDLLVQSSARAWQQSKQSSHGQAYSVARIVVNASK